MKAQRIIMALSMTTGKEFRFYVPDEKHFNEVYKKLCDPNLDEKVECIPTLTVEPKYVISIEKFYEELKG